MARELATWECFVIPRLRITEVPLVGGPDAELGRRLTALRRGLLPALTQEAAAGRPVSFCWTRPVAGGPVEVRAEACPVGARAVP
ncbi:MAG TPA: hypothetical protein VG497_22120, partial [Kribbella sp.]|nr:hypothetical protein [Kribbella sp.]